MIDLHSHFLPAIDDGAKTADESIAMLADDYRQGVTVCAGTSHANIHREERIDAFLEKRKNSIELLEKALIGRNVQIPRLLYGAEIYLDNDISLIDGIERLCIGDTRCMLMELSTSKYNPRYNEWIYSLTVKGILPIIAHVERYHYLDSLLTDLEGVDVVYQVNSKTVAGFGGKKWVLDLDAKGATVVVSADMHNTGDRRSFMKKAYSKLNGRYPDIADAVFKTNARKILGI